MKFLTYHRIKSRFLKINFVTKLRIKSLNKLRKKLRDVWHNRLRKISRKKLHNKLRTFFLIGK